MNCHQFRDDLHGYFLERLAKEAHGAIEEHAETCAACGALMRTAQELSCRQFIDFLNEYLDGELPSDRKAVFERHLGICPDCTNYLDSYRKTMRLSVLAVGAEPIPKQPPEELVQAILRARRG